MFLLLAPRDVVFFSIEDMNRAVRERLESLDNRRMQGWGVSRSKLFETQERAVLQSLPREPWEWRDWLKPRISGPNRHFRVDKYSCMVPSDWRAVATGINRYTTDAAHARDWQWDMQASEGSSYEDWLLAEARKIGPHSEAWKHPCLGSKDFPPVNASLRLRPPSGI